MTISDQEFEDAAKAPERVTNDEGTVVEKPVEELIMADRYVNSKNVTKPPFGMRVARIKPGGTTSSSTD